MTKAFSKEDIVAFIEYYTPGAGVDDNGYYIKKPRVKDAGKRQLVTVLGCIVGILFGFEFGYAIYNFVTAYFLEIIMRSPLLTVYFVLTYIANLYIKSNKEYLSQNEVELILKKAKKDGLEIKK